MNRNIKIPNKNLFFMIIFSLIMGFIGFSNGYIDDVKHIYIVGEKAIFLSIYFNTISLILIFIYLKRLINYKMKCRKKLKNRLLFYVMIFYILFMIMLIIEKYLYFDIVIYIIEIIFLFGFIVSSIITYNLYHKQFEEDFKEDNEKQ